MKWKWPGVRSHLLEASRTVPGAFAAPGGALLPSWIIEQTG